MTDEIPHRRAYEQGWAKTIPVAAVVSAIGLAWTISASWVAFRDDVFGRCHAAATRITALEAYRVGHDRSDELQQQQIERIQLQLEEFRSSRETGWHGFESRLRRLEARQP